ncbi:MAG: glutamate synthase subunit beta [Sphaerochaetaceae bacterium]|nr:glutamate synthase subunit beta [Sphaerochaetaceae bacterium]
MPKLDGFRTIKRKEPPYRDVEERICDFEPVNGPLSESEVVEQARRCMDCGVPFCHMHGCPLGNRIPDYSELIANGQWKEALTLLESTNNFPEVTGRICPAPCETSCTLATDFEAVTCEQIELNIAERGWREGWVVPEIAPIKTGKRVAIVGSGPTGLAAAQQLARKGHEVIVFEKSDRIGGLLMYGIPNFKLEKEVIDRRLAQMKAEGVIFEKEVEIGTDLSAHYLLSKFDAVVIASGTPLARDISIPGRDLKGIHFALEYLTQQTKLVLGDTIAPEDYIDAKGKNVVVIGGGDTGSDCVGSVIRRGCASVTQIELLPKPPEMRQDDNPWPQWPRILRTSSSHKEGATRMWSVGSKEFIGKDGRVKKFSCVNLKWKGREFTEIPGSEFILDADLVLLSMGFVPYRESPLVKEFGLAVDERGSIAVDSKYRTSKPKIFAAGDAVIGASLVVRAINYGRECAESVDSFLSE